MTFTPTRCFSADSGISFLRAGPADGRAVLLIHGLGWDAARLWTGAAQALAAAGFQVIAPDLKGVGQSALLQGPVTIADYADDLDRLLAERGLVAPVIVGFSMGVMVAVTLSARPRLRPTALVLACGLVTAGPSHGTEAMLERAKTLGPAHFAQEQAGVVFGPAFRQAHPAMVADFVAWRAAMDQASLHHAFRASYGIDLQTEAAGISCPTLVIAAADDPFVDPSAAQHLAATIPGADFTLIPDCGHMAPVERPELFDAAILDHLTGSGRA